MGTCYNCGYSITFVHIRGKPTPLGCRCGQKRKFSANSSYNYSKGTSCAYSKSYEIHCHLTTCPHCPDRVYFIRHNGGSVWIDPPLGPPWYIHECMDSRSSGGRRDGAAELNPRTSLAAQFPSLPLNTAQGHLILGVVIEAKTLLGRTLLRLQTGNRQDMLLLVKFADFLVGKLVVYNPRGKSLRWIEDAEYKYKVLTDIDELATRKNSMAIIKCLFCDQKIRRSLEGQHLRDFHSLFL